MNSHQTVVLVGYSGFLHHMQTVTVKPKYESKVADNQTLTKDTSRHQWVKALTCWIKIYNVNQKLHVV